jgi:virginiamycin B lyase
VTSFRRCWTPVWSSLILFLSLSAIAFAQSTASYALFTVPTVTAAPEGIVSGPDTGIWFTECQGNNIGTITLTGNFTEYPLPASSSCPFRIASGSDGALWFTEYQNFNHQIGRITTAGAITEYALPNSANKLIQAYAIAPGSDGALWFTSPNTSQIGTITTSGQITMYPLPVSTTPGAIVAGPDGALWFLDNTFNIGIGRITTSGAVTMYPIPAALVGTLGSITVGPDQALWFTDSLQAGGAAIGRISTSGAITSFPVPAALDGLVTGPDGTLWFSSNTVTLGNITTSGVYTAYTCEGEVLSTNESNPCFPNQLVLGANGNMWFTDSVGSFIGEITLSGFSISSISPNNVTLGSITATSSTSGVFNLTINGAGFLNGATVQFGDTDPATLLPTFFVTTAQLTATVPINLSTGQISVTVINPGGAVSNALPLTVNPAANTTITITTPSLPDGVVGTPYSQTLVATGGTPPYTWAILVGSLPAGLTLSPAGVIYGVPTAAGPQTFTVGLTDSDLVPASLSLSLNIDPAAVLTSNAVRVPQILDGAGWTTGFTIVNIDQVPVTFSFNFWDDSGNVLAFPILNGTPGLLTATLNPGATYFAQSPGVATALQQGWAEVNATGKVGVMASFALESSGTRGEEAAISGVQSGNSIFMPFDNTQGFTTAVAIANSNATQTLTVALTFLTDAGVSSSANLVLPPKAHTAFDVPTAYPALANSRGSINFTASTADIAVTGLQFSPAAVGAITTLGTTNPALVSSSPLSIPQILDGAGWTTGFVIENVDQVPVNFTFQFFGDSGSPLAFPILNGTPGVLSGTLKPGATLFAQSPGTASALMQGWAQVTGTGLIAVTGTLALQTPGTRGQEAAVQGTPSASSIFMPFDNTRGNATAIGIANSNASVPLTVTLTFLTQAGVSSSATISLPPKAHSAFVLPTAYPALAGVSGSINFTASTPDIAVTGLRFAPTVIGAITSLGIFE